MSDVKNDKVSEYFRRSEFACKCGKCQFSDFPPVDSALLELLDAVREHIGQPMVISSGWRCPEHNKTIGGVPHSQHVRGLAADFHFPDGEPAMLLATAATYIENDPSHVGGLGRYDTFVHVDVRGVKARWDNRTTV